jgi:O-antigen/teichoic acid export membrane protein
MSELPPRTSAHQVGISLRARVLRAGSWTLVAHFGALASRFVGSLVLTRIFTPDVFGVLSIVNAVWLIVTLLTDIGLRQAVIQSHIGGERSFLNTAWTVQVLRGFFVWFVGGIVALGLYVANSYGLFATDSVYSYPNLPCYIAGTLFSAIVIGFQSMKWVTASRELEVERLLLIEFLAQIGGLVFTVLLGWATQSIWAYVGATNVSSAIVVIFSHAMLSGKSDRFCWDRKALAELSQFGRWTFLSSALSTFALNGDRLLLSGWVNAQFLGYYSVANNLSSVPDGIANRVFGTVLFPALSEAAREKPKEFSRVYFKMRWVTDASILLFAGILVSAGPALVHLLYDSRYEAAGWILQYLSLSLVFSRYGITQSAYLALGKPQYLTAISIIKLISLFGFVPLLYLDFGIRGAILGIAAHMFPVAICMVYFNAKHGLNDFLFEFVVLFAFAIGWLAGFGISGIADWLFLALRSSHGAI